MVIHLLWKPPGSFCTPPAVGPRLLALDLDVKGWAAAQCALAPASLAGGDVTRARAGAEPGPDHQWVSVHVCVLRVVVHSVQPQPEVKLSVGAAAAVCHTCRGQRGLTVWRPELHRCFRDGEVGSQTISQILLYCAIVCSTRTTYLVLKRINVKNSSNKTVTLKT